MPIYDLSSLFFKTHIGNYSITASINNGFYRDEKEEEVLFRETVEMARAHFHPQHELFFAQDIPLRLEIEGKKYVLQNCAFVIPAFTHHVIESRACSYCFCFEIKQTTPTENDPLFPFFSLFEKGPLTLATEPFIFECLSRLSISAKKRDFMFIDESAALLRLVLASLYRNNNIAHTNEENVAINDYCVVIDYFVNNHYTENVTLSNVAEALHLSTKQTSRIIQKKYHATLSELLNKKRLRVAAKLLVNTDKTISEIASHLFYRSENYFYRLFREAYGISPLAYRKKYFGQIHNADITDI